MPGQLNAILNHIIFLILVSSFLSSDHVHVWTGNDQNALHMRIDSYSIPLLIISLSLRNHYQNGDYDIHLIPHYVSFANEISSSPSSIETPNGFSTTTCLPFNIASFTYGK